MESISTKYGMDERIRIQDSDKMWKSFPHFFEEEADNDKNII